TPQTDAQQAWRSATRALPLVRPNSPTALLPLLLEFRRVYVSCRSVSYHSRAESFHIRCRPPPAEAAPLSVPVSRAAHMQDSPTYPRSSVRLELSSDGR